MSSNSRRAFTLVELLVVIAIIGILIALLLPAVQAAREAARRTQCSNNLTQLIIAVNNYETAHCVYPTGTIDASGPIRSLPSGYHHGWITQVLPYVEQTNAYHHIDRTVSVYHRNNTPVRKLRINTLLCPSSGGSAPGGYADYAGAHHDVEAPIDVDNHGIFFLNSHVAYDDVRDGSSQTLFIGEKLTVAGDLGWMSGTRATLRNTGTTINDILRGQQAGRRRLDWPRSPPGETERIDAMGALIEGEDGAMYGDMSSMSGSGMMEMSDEGGEAADEEGAETAEENEVDAVEEGSPEVTEESSEDEAEESPSDDVMEALAEEEYGEADFAATVDGVPIAPTAVGGFSSHHPGGANFALGDGSVRLLSETIDTQVYQQLGHRADGKLLDEF